MKKRSKVFENVIGTPFYIILSLFIVLPMLFLLLYSINSNSEHGFDISFTLNHYINFFSQPIFLLTLGRSLLVAIIATFFLALIGYPLAYAISRKKAKTQVLLIIMITIPMWMNMLIRVEALKQVFSFINQYFYESNVAVIIANVYVYLPFMVLPIYTVLSKIDKNILESAADLGANKIKTFIKVVFPLSLSGLLSGFIMTFLPAATTLVIPEYFGKNLYMIGNLIEETIINKDYGGYGYGASISIVLSLIMIVFVFFLRRTDRYNGGLK